MSSHYSDYLFLQEFYCVWIKNSEEDLSCLISYFRQRRIFTMNLSTSMSLTKTKFVHAMYTYLEFGSTVLKLSTLFYHINLTFSTSVTFF